MEEPRPQTELPTTTMHGDVPANAPGEGKLTSWGPFELHEKCGEGAFGEVYRAWDPKLQREVALKLLRPKRALSAEGIELMLREARNTAKVRHPNIVSVHGVDEHEGRVGYWTDFVRGKTLHALLSAHGPFGAREAALIGVELCAALSAVHAAGLLHRDIKPGNAMREEGGRILLMDFGLMLPSAGAEQASLAGTIAYMAPELLAGKPATVGSDIYALGALLFELVTGKLPVRPSEGAANQREAHVRGTHRTLFEERSDLPVAFSRVVETAKDTVPEKRFASAGQLMAALSDAIGITTASSPAVPVPRRRARWWIAAVAVLAIAAAAVPLWRGKLPRGFDRAMGRHAEYGQAQELLDHYYRLHSLDKAIPLFQKAIAEDPKYAPAWVGLGKAYWRKYLDTRDDKYVPLAKETCDKAIELGEQLSPAHVTLGMIYTDAGRYDLATQELEQARRLDDTNAEAYGALYDLYRGEKRAKDADAALQKAIDLEPNNWRWVNLLAIYYRSYSDPVRLSDAVAQFQKAIALSRDNPRIYSNLGTAYKDMDRFPEAEAAFRKAIAIGGFPSAFSNLGALQQLTGKYAEAAETYRKALEEDPSDYTFAGNLASTLTWAKSSDARNAYLRAIQLAESFRRNNPKNTRVLADLGSFYASVGDAEKSLPLLRQVLALDPHNARVLYTAGEAYELLHRRDEALRYLGEAVHAGYSLEYIEREPELSDLRADSRFSAILHKK